MIAVAVILGLYVLCGILVWPRSGVCPWCGQRTRVKHVEQYGVTTVVVSACPACGLDLVETH